MGMGIPSGDTHRGHRLRTGAAVVLTVLAALAGQAHGAGQRP